ncbi:MAG: nitrous oxide reductase accessory protein NosL [Proteobacteria bacterium]|nr:nitrous oxide reductase accessory protein NosL [Pseudomonadota bacterium]
MASRTQRRCSLHRWCAPIVLLVLLAGCNAAPPPARRAVDVRPDDTCAVCGMELARSPGPRGQAWVSGHAQPLMFDSTRDFFAYVLQPENRSVLQDLYVQDTARIDWRHPGRDAGTFIDARSATYVVWQPLPGSMGPTLAPFADHEAAEAFAQAHGGAVLAFAAITPDLIATLGYRCPATPAQGAAACIRVQATEPTASAPPVPHAH